MDLPPISPAEFVARTCRALLDRAEELAEEIALEIEQKEPSYGSHSLISPDELRSASRENLIAMLSSLTDQPTPDLVTPYLTGRNKASQGVPLADVLRAYQIGSSVVWQHFIQLAGDDYKANSAVPSAVSYFWRLFDDYTQAMSAAYQETAAEQARYDDQVRAAALDALLAGQLDPAKSWECATLLGIPERGSYVVVAARRESGDDDALPGIAEAVAALGAISAWRFMLDSQVGIVALSETFGVGALREELAKRNRTSVGVSSVYTRLQDSHDALRQAQLACAAAPLDTMRVLCYRDGLVPVLLASNSDIADQLATAVIGPVLALPAHERNMLLLTMRCWFDQDGETSAVAKSLYCHRNTVRFRMNRIAELTGRNLSSPVQATELYLALEAHRIAAARTR